MAPAVASMGAMGVTAAAAASAGATRLTAQASRATTRGLARQPGSGRAHAWSGVVSSAAQEQQQLAASPAQQQPASTTQQQQPRATTRSSRAAPLPEPAAHQQTLRRAIVLGGVGLHSGEYAHVRVLPAFAGEGRYFVRAASGTVSPHWQVEAPAVRELEEAGPGSSATAGGGAAADEEWAAQLFFEFVEGQEAGTFSGSFAEYLQGRGLGQPDGLLMDADAELRPEVEPSAGTAGEQRLPARASALRPGHPQGSLLGEGALEIKGAEHLLAALECCGVDNARIEVEGGSEIPIVDGSALGWAAEVQRSGLRPAPPVAGGDAQAPKSACEPQQVVTVQDGESFITFYPAPTSRVTVGIDCEVEASVIGRQWYSWSPEELGPSGGDHFRWALAPARSYFASPQAVEALMGQGLLQAGPDYVSLIGHGEDWVDATMVRFPADEPARHAVVDLLGYLSLLARGGGRGLPSGHVVAYQPTHALQASFVQRLQAAAGGGA